MVLPDGGVAVGAAADFGVQSGHRQRPLVVRKRGADAACTWLGRKEFRHCDERGRPPVREPPSCRAAGCGATARRRAARPREAAPRSSRSGRTTGCA
jgi:hypothetical protein